MTYRPPLGSHGRYSFFVLNEYFFELNPRKNPVWNIFLNWIQEKNQFWIIFLNWISSEIRKWITFWIEYFRKKKFWIIFELNIFGKLSFEYFLNWIFWKIMFWIILWIDFLQVNTHQRQIQITHCCIHADWIDILRVNEAKTLKIGTLKYK